MDVSLVIPVYNEETCLDELLDRCLATGDGLGVPYEIILVDDGSRDRSRAIIEARGALRPEIVGVFLNRNYGQHAAVMAGFARSRGEVVVTLDADLQNPPEEIPRLLAKVAEGHDVVGSIRARRQDTLFRRLASRTVNSMVRRMTGIDMRDYGCMLRAYRREIVDTLLTCRETTRFIPVLANSFAANPAEIPVAHAERGSGDSKYSLFKLVNLYLDLLTCMSTFPLRLASIVGMLMSLIGLAAGLTLFVGRLVYGSEWAVDGIFTVFSLEFVFLGGIYLSVGILGEYAARIYNDVRARPAYCVRRVVGRGLADTATSDTSDEKGSA
ncbi:MAG: glycosyltransferase [Planctomycetes bacterium]|nr:glycosyltransferase [Planctomycetota bacterium]